MARLIMLKDGGSDGSERAAGSVKESIRAAATSNTARLPVRLGCVRGKAQYVSAAPASSKISYDVEIYTKDRRPQEMRRKGCHEFGLKAWEL